LFAEEICAEHFFAEFVFAEFIFAVFAQFRKKNSAKMNKYWYPQK